MFNFVPSAAEEVVDGLESSFVRLYFELSANKALQIEHEPMLLVKNNISPKKSIRCIRILAAR